MSQNVNVNLVPGNYPKEFHVSQYDVGRQLVANIVDSTGAYSIPSGATVTLVGTKPSGFGFTLSGSVGSGGVVTFSTTATVTAEYGRIPCEIRITSGSTILGTANCMLIVEESPHPEGTTDGDGEVIVNQITLLLEQITQQADRAVAASEAAQASETAAAASEANAATSESNAAASAATAVGAKNDAVAAKTAAQASEQAAAESAAEARETLETYAKVDGEYDSMTVGTAKQLLSDSTTTDTEPYIYRQTAGDADREEVEEVVGGTVAWNQILQNGNFASTSGWQQDHSTISVSNNVLTMKPSATGRTSFAIRGFNLDSGMQAVGHKYLGILHAKPNASMGSYMSLYGLYGTIKQCTANVWTEITHMFSLASVTSNYTVRAYAIRENGPEFTLTEEIQFKDFMVFDLTAMFGSTVADAIYAMEQANAGAGVAWFKKLFPKDYYPYDAGSLQSVKASAHVTKDADENVIGNYPLSPIDLRGIPKWVDGKLAYDGDVYSADGKVTRRYGLRAYQSGDESLADAITDGANTVYKLATPTTETADPYTAIQVCDPNGTEEWTDERTVQIPVGNVTKYHANLKEKLEDLPAIPSAPSANGTYTLKATVSGGAVTYQWVNG